ncbi:MAG TPA: PepSY domain-containing protein [Woeseiaceae bacterium]|nr:PepSY domain-containing protein [Woeseiaceae bacterium]
MTLSKPKADSGARLRIWLRRGHRWLGVVLVFFVLLLAISGIALNHAEAWGLDRRYLGWSWLLDAYGIEAPPPSASFADGGHRATLLGGHLYFDGVDIARDVEALSGLAVLDPLALVATSDRAFILTTSGKLVQSIDVAAELPSAVARVGRAGGVAVMESGGRLYRSDPEITVFEPWEAAPQERIWWSSATSPGAADLEVLQRLYRGRGLTVERVLADLHSGRILAIFGTLLMDLVAVCMIVLSLSGLIMWIQHSRRENGIVRRNGGQR